MEGFGMHEIPSNKEAYELVKNKIEYKPGDLVIAKKSPPGIYNEDLKDSVFIVKYAVTNLTDELAENEAQPDNLPFYVCTNAEFDELIFSNDELESLHLSQLIKLFKVALLYKNNQIPTRWSDDYYPIW